jgi:hypothetical protein
LKTSNLSEEVQLDVNSGDEVGTIYEGRSTGGILYILYNNFFGLIYRIKNMHLDLIAILYTCFRLAPFIIICTFAFSSFFNQDVKGLVFLAGLLVACFVAVVVGRSFSYIYPNPTHTNNSNVQICNSFSLSNTGRLSEIPLSIVIFTFTLSYLTSLVSYYNVVIQNVPLFVTFPLLIIADLFWIIKNQCGTAVQCFVGIIVGALVGVIWGSVIIGTNDQNYLYFSGYGPNKDVCYVPSLQKFKCSVDK